MKPLELFFDARFIRVGQHDGISRFSVGLFEALAKRVKLTAIVSDLKQLDKLPSATSYLLVNEPTSVKELWLARKLNRAGAKFVFSTMQTMGSFGKRYKLILTLHDLIYYRHPAPPPSLSAPIRLLWRLFHLSYWPERFLLNRADSVVAVSATTKRLMISHNLTKRPIAVIYNAAGAFDESMPKPKSRPVGASKLLYMGSFMSYKNVETLILGLNHLPEHELHLLSKIDAKRRTQLEALIPRGAKVVFHDGVSEEAYRNLLKTSVALVSASLDEGFGIPLIEAMSLGIPVVVSDIEIFREIGGDAAVYFEATSPQAFAQAVSRLNSNPDWMTFSKLASQNAKRFSWSESATELLKVIEELST
ncbi:MAG: glycosyltransferase family 1 protein [Actinomycetes bacterium]